MAKKNRKPQINFQVTDPMKMLYEEAKESGHWVTRFCAAGFLLLIEDNKLRKSAIDRLRDWEAEYQDASPDDIRRFVDDAETAPKRPSRSAPSARRSTPGRKKAKRA